MMNDGTVSTIARPRVIHITERTIDIPQAQDIAAYAPGLAYEGTGERVLFTIGTHGSSSRLASLDVATGGILLGPRLMGGLRDAYRTQDGALLWALCDYGLYALDPFTLNASPKIKVPKFRHALVPFAHDTAVALAQPMRVRTPVVRRSSTTTVTISCPTPSLGLDTGETSWLLSFSAGEAREFRADLTPTRRRRGLPRGLSPRRIGDLVYFVAASLGHHPSETSAKEPRIPWVNAEDELCVFSLKDWKLERSRRIADLFHVLGSDESGRIVAAAGKRTPGDPIFLLLIDPITLAELERYLVGNDVQGDAIAGRNAAAFRVNSRQIRLLAWS